MGALKSGAFPVELNGKEYGLLFSLNALDEVQEEFGGYDKLSEVFNKDNPNLFKDTRWLLTLLINEALLAEDENAQLLEEKRVGRLIHAGNYPAAAVAAEYRLHLAAVSAGRLHRNYRGNLAVASEQPGDVLLLPCELLLVGQV